MSKRFVAPLQPQADWVQSLGAAPVLRAAGAGRIATGRIGNVGFAMTWQLPSSPQGAPECPTARNFSEVAGNCRGGWAPRGVDPLSRWLQVIAAGCDETPSGVSLLEGRFSNDTLHVKSNASRTVWESLASEGIRTDEPLISLVAHVKLQRFLGARHGILRQDIVFTLASPWNFNPFNRLEHCSALTKNNFLRSGRGGGGSVQVGGSIKTKMTKTVLSCDSCSYV